MKITSPALNFQGVYVSRAFAVGKQRERANNVAAGLRESGLSYKYEREYNKDILIRPITGDSGLEIKFVKYNPKRILDDNYSRWNGKIN